MDNLARLKKFLPDFCDSCSRNHVLKVGLCHQFDEADNGIKNKATTAVNPSLGTGPSP